MITFLAWVVGWLVIGFCVSSLLVVVQKKILSQFATFVTGEGTFWLAVLAWPYSLFAICFLAPLVWFVYRPHRKTKSLVARWIDFLEGKHKNQPTNRIEA